TITGTTGDLPGMGLWFQSSTQRPAFTYQDATGAATLIDLPNQADVQQVQTNLTAAIASQAATNATLSADISDCVSGIYGKGSGDYQMLGLYQQESTGRPIAVYNNGTTNVFEGIAIAADITTVQSNLTTFQTSQANENATLASGIATSVQQQNDSTTDGITRFGYSSYFGAMWAVGASGTARTWVTSSASHVTGDYDTFVMGSLRFLSFKVMASDTQTITFPVAFSEAPYVAVSSSETRDGEGNSVSANVYYGTTTKSQFNVHLAQYGTAIPSTAPVEVTVMAMGAA
ncbi:gp53-like domain-containing protein, partial [Komagataeibacter europaeus]